MRSTEKYKQPHAKFIALLFCAVIAMIEWQMQNRLKRFSRTHIAHTKKSLKHNFDLSINPPYDRGVSNGYLTLNTLILINKHQNDVERAT